MQNRGKLVGMMVNQLRQTYRSEGNWTRNNPIAHAKAGAYKGLDVLFRPANKTTTDLTKARKHSTAQLPARIRRSAATTLR